MKTYKTIPGYENYSISRNGIVINKRGKKLKVKKYRNLKYYHLFKNGKTVSIMSAKLVLLTYNKNFNPNIHGINFIDNNTLNSNIKNLEVYTKPTSEDRQQRILERDKKGYTRKRSPVHYVRRKKCYAIRIHWDQANQEYTKGIIINDSQYPLEQIYYIAECIKRYTRARNIIENKNVSEFEEFMYTMQKYNIDVFNLTPPIQDDWKQVMTLNTLLLKFQKLCFKSENQADQMVNYKDQKQLEVFTKEQDQIHIQLGIN